MSDDSKQPPATPETVVEALTAIVKTRKCNQRRDELLASDNTDGYNSPRANKVKKLEDAFFIAYRKTPGLSNPKTNPLYQKVEHTRESYWIRYVNPHENLLNEGELAELTQRFSLKEDEKNRLLCAHDNLKARMETLCGEEAKGRQIKYVLSLFRSKKEPYNGEGAARLAFADILHVKGVNLQTAGRAISTADTLQPLSVVLRTPFGTDNEKLSSALYILLKEHGLYNVEGIQKLVDGIKSEGAVDTGITYNSQERLVAIRRATDPNPPPPARRAREAHDRAR